jgi:O-antigen/teichoic acid export membrane protein
MLPVAVAATPSALRLRFTSENGSRSASRARLQRLQRLRRFRLNGGGIHAASVAGTGATAAVFHVVATRTLGPSSYGALGSLLAVLMMLSVPIGTVQTRLSERVARLAETGARPAPRTLTRRLAVLAGAAGAALCLTVPAAVGYLHLSGPGPVLWLAAALIARMLGIVPWSLLCGTGRLGRVGAATAAGFGVRLVLGSLLLACGFGVSGAMAATVAGECVLVAALGAGAHRAVVREGYRGAAELDLTLREAARGSLSAMGLWTLFGIDLVAARHRLAPDAAGVYAATALTTRAVLALAHATATTDVPRFAAAGGRRRPAAALRNGLLAAMVAGALGTCVLAAAGPQLLGLVFGRAYAGGVGLDLLLGLDATVLALLSVLIRFRLARHARATVAGWGGSLCFAVGQSLLPATSVCLAAALGAGALCALAIAASQPFDGPDASAGDGARLRRGPRPSLPRRRTGEEAGVSGPRTPQPRVPAPASAPGPACAPTPVPVADEHPGSG